MIRAILQNQSKVVKLKGPMGRLLSSSSLRESDRRWSEFQGTVFSTDRAAGKMELNFESPKGDEMYSIDIHAILCIPYLTTYLPN